MPVALTVAVAQAQRWLRLAEARRLGMLLACALLVRLIFLPFPGFYDDLQYYAYWGQRLGPHFLSFYSATPLANYPPLSIYLFGLVVAGYSLAARLLGAQPVLVVAHSPALAMALKLPSTFAELVTIMVVYCLARQVRSPRWALTAAAVYAFSPPILLDGALWGQSDAISTLLVAGALLCALSRHGWWSGLLLAAAVTFKPQPIIFVPLLLDYLWRWTGGREVLRCLGGFVGGVLAICLPYELPPRPELLAFVANVQHSFSPHANINALNLWWLATQLHGANLVPSAPMLGPLTPNLVGWGLFAACGVLVALGIWRDGEPRTLWLGAAVLALAFFVFTTQQHERYAYPALLLLLVAAVYRNRTIIWYALASLLMLLQLVIAIALDSPGSYPSSVLFGLKQWFVVGGHGAYLAEVAMAFVALLLALLVAYLRGLPGARIVPETAVARPGDRSAFQSSLRWSAHLRAAADAMRWSFTAASERWPFNRLIGYGSAPAEDDTDPAPTARTLVMRWRTTQRLRNVVRDRLRAWWPALTTVVVLLLAIWHHAAINGFRRITDFIEVGRQFAVPMGLASLATSPIGYDGQYYYFIARFPGRVPAGAFDLPALRYSRIVYPLLTRLSSLGQPSVMPWAMLGINVAAIAGTVALLAAMLRARGLPPWLALVAGLYCGQPLGMLRDLTDPLMVFWLTLALWGISRERWLVTAAALGLGMLTREAMLPFVICFAVPLVVERNWRLLALYGAIALVPYGVWAIIIRALFGTWGLSQTTQSSMFLPLPFAGLLSAPSAGLAASMFLVACVPALAAMGYAVYALRQRPWHDALLLAAALGALLYGVSFVLQPGVHWLDVWEPPRLAAPFAVLLPLLIPRAARRPGWYAVPWLMLGSVLIAFAV